MPMDARGETVREAVAVFDTADQLQGAIDQLLSSGFDRAELSLLASDHAVTDKLGHKYRRVEELEDDPSVPRRAYVSTESIGDAEGAVIGSLMYVTAGILMGPVAYAGGSLAAIAAAAAAGLGAGGLIGASLAGLIGQQRAQQLDEQLGHGGLLLWVRVRNPTLEARAVEILSGCSGRDVHVHEIK